MRIAILGPTYPYRGGISQHTMLLAHHLRTAHDVTLVTFSRQYPAWLYKGRTDQDPSDASPATAEAGERLLDPLNPLTWWRTARRIRAAWPHIVVIPWWVPFWAPSVATVAGLVRRWTGAEVIFLCHNVLPHDGGNLLDRTLTRAALRWGTGFIVHAETDAGALRRLVPDQATEGRVARTLLPAFTLAPPADRAAARSALAVPEGACVALFFGFVRPYKGLAVLLDAMPAVLAAVPNAYLLVAGEFWAPAAHFQARAARLGIADRVRFDDRYIPNEAVGPYFAAADVVVQPYLEASQSAVVSLAVDLGVPVVASRVGGLPEAVAEGVSGLTVVPGDPALLAAALVRVFTEPGMLARLRHGTAEARARFGWEHTVAAIEGLGRHKAG